MAVLPPIHRPSVAFRDLLAFMRQRSREQVIYVDLYNSNRTDAEIIADQKKDQAEKDAYAKEKQRQFQELEKKLGMD